MGREVFPHRQGEGGDAGEIIGLGARLLETRIGQGALGGEKVGDGGEADLEGCLE